MLNWSEISVFFSKHFNAGFIFIMSAMREAVVIQTFGITAAILNSIVSKMGCSEGKYFVVCL